MEDNLSYDEIEMPDASQLMMERERDRPRAEMDSAEAPNAAHHFLIQIPDDNDASHRGNEFGDRLSDPPQVPVDGETLLEKFEDHFVIPNLDEIFDTQSKSVFDSSEKADGKIIAKMKMRDPVSSIEKDNITHLEPSLRSECTIDLSQKTARYDMDIGYMQFVLERDHKLFYKDYNKSWEYWSQFLFHEYCVLDQNIMDKSDPRVFQFYSIKRVVSYKAKHVFKDPITIMMSDGPQSTELVNNLKRKRRFQKFHTCVTIRVHLWEGEYKYYPIYSFEWLFDTTWLPDQSTTPTFGIRRSTQPIEIPNSSFNYPPTYLNSFFIIYYHKNENLFIDIRLSEDLKNKVRSKVSKDIYNSF